MGLYGKKMSPQTCLSVLYAEFGSDFSPMSFDCSMGQIQQLCYLFCGLSHLYKMSYLDFSRGQALVS